MLRYYVYKQEKNDVVELLSTNDDKQLHDLAYELLTTCELTDVYCRHELTTELLSDMLVRSSVDFVKNVFDNSQKSECLITQYKYISQYLLENLRKEI